MSAAHASPALVVPCNSVMRPDGPRRMCVTSRRSGHRSFALAAHRWFEISERRKPSSSKRTVCHLEEDELALNASSSPWYQTPSRSRASTIARTSPRLPWRWLSATTWEDRAVRAVRWRRTRLRRFGSRPRCYEGTEASAPGCRARALPGPNPVVAQCGSALRSNTVGLAPGPVQSVPSSRRPGFRLPVQVRDRVAHQPLDWLGELTDRQQRGLADLHVIDEGRDPDLATPARRLGFEDEEDIGAARRAEPNGGQFFARRGGVFVLPAPR